MDIRVYPRLHSRSRQSAKESEELLRLGLEPERSIETILETGLEFVRQLRLGAVAIFRDVDGDGGVLGPFLTAFKDNRVAGGRRGDDLERPRAEEFLGVSPSLLRDEAANSFIRFPKVQAGPDDSRIALQHGG